MDNEIRRNSLQFTCRCTRKSWKSNWSRETELSWWSLGTIWSRRSLRSHWTIHTWGTGGWRWRRWGWWRWWRWWWWWSWITTCYRTTRGATFGTSWRTRIRTSFVVPKMFCNNNNNKKMKCITVLYISLLLN